MFFLFICFLLLLLILVILTIKVKFEIINLQFNSNCKKHINSDFQLQIIVYILYKIPVFKTKITRQKLNSIKQKDKIIEKLKEEEIKAFENRKDASKNILEVIKNIKIEIEEMNLKINLGTENAALTALIVPILSTIIAVFCSKKIKKLNERQKFEIQPVYINQNLINILFSGIFEIRMIHIINTICIMKKKRKGDKNERTSNRGTYDYSYE